MPVAALAAVLVTAVTTAVNVAADGVSRALGRDQVTAPRFPMDSAPGAASRPPDSGARMPPAHRSRPRDRSTQGLRHGVAVGGTVLVAAILVSAALAVPDTEPVHRPDWHAGATWDAPDEATERTFRAIRRAHEDAATRPPGGFAVVDSIQQGTVEYVRWRVGWLRGEIARINRLNPQTQDDRLDRAAYVRELAGLTR